MIFVWYDANQKKKKLNEFKKPIYTTPNVHEGFQDLPGVWTWLPGLIAGPATDAPMTSYVDATTGSGSGSRTASASGSGSGSSSGSGSRINFFGTSRDYDYGEWYETTSDSYYDAYELNETYAVINELTKIKDSVPIEKEILNFGSSLAAFDSDTPEIPWDTDNKSYRQSEVVWGLVSPEASKSIFLKTWLREIANNVDAMEPCGEQSVNYCYRAPFLNISTTDPSTASQLKVAEAALNSLSGAAIAVILVQNSADLLSFRGIVDFADADDVRKMYQTMYDKLTITSSTPPPKPMIKLTGRNKVFTQLGSQLKGLGSRVLNKLMKGINAVVKSKLVTTLQQATARSVERISACLGAAEAARVAAVAFAAVSCGTSAIPAPSALVTVPLCLKASTIATTFTVLVTILYIFFGLFGTLIMTLTAIITPIITSLMDTGGVCPQGSKPLSEILPSAAIDFIEGFMPIGMLMAAFNPYVCYKADGTAVLKIPPKLPDFMSDNTLSLTYHAAWQVGYNANIPTAEILNYSKDPLPAGYAWIEDSDVRHLHQSSSLRSLTGGKPQILAVELCTGDTVPSADGTQCLSKSYNTNVKPASLSACPADKPYDDGFNCWKTKISSETCNAGELTITSSTSWNDTTGYVRVNTTGVTCTTGQIAPTDILLAKERAVCNNDGDGTEYEKELDGLVCYAKCRAGFSRSGAICNGSSNPKTRDFKVITSSMYKEQKMDTELLTSLSQVTVPYCDFADKRMLDRMAQFYNKYAIKHPKIEEDGRITIQRIIGFYGVIASSELSCDVICQILHITYEPISGAKLSIVEGCSSSYTEDEKFKGINQCFRRFYFIKGDNDPQGIFTVTGCTFADYTAPDSMVLTYDVDSNLVHSLPKTWNRTDKSATIVNTGKLREDMQSGRIAAQTGKGLLDVTTVILATVIGQAAGGLVGRGISAAALQKAALAATRAAAKTGGDYVSRLAAATVAKKAIEAAAAVTKGGVATTAGLVGGLAGAVGGGLGMGMVNTLYLDAAIDKASNSAITPEDSTDAVHTSIVGSDRNLSLVTNANWWRIEHGPIWELAPGYTPNINFCEGVQISEQHCAYKYVVRNMVNQYHAFNERRHIRTITDIEPRGVDGCYYKFKEVVYDPLTNREGDIEDDKEIILKHEIADTLTCTFKPKNIGISSISVNMADPSYQVRTTIDPSTEDSTNKKTIYPTRNAFYTTDLLARYVRVRPPISEGNGILTIAQVAVFDVSGRNISVKKPTYATSTMPTSGPPENVVNGVLSGGTNLGSVWQASTSQRNTEYWEVDLEQTLGISEIFYFGSNFKDSAGSTLAGNNKGVRIQFLYTNGPSDTPIHEYVLENNDSKHFVELYSSKYMKPKYPLSGAIKIPRPTARTIMLAADQGCVNKCEDRGVMDSIMGQYNTNPSNANTQIVKILRGITSAKDTCEYEAEVLVTDTPDDKNESGDIITVGKKSITKQYLSMTVSPVVNRYTGRIFARYVRILPSFTDGTVLELSNIRVWNAVPDGTTGKMKKGYNIALNKKTSYYNEYYELNEMTPSPPAVKITDGGDAPEPYPNVFKARSNDPLTFFQIDLGDTGGTGSTRNSCMGSNSEIHSIDFYGRSDRMPGGIKGICIELYVDVPDDNENCCNGTYAPVFRHFLPTDDESQTIQISPPALCNFILTSTDVLSKPYFLQDNTPPLSAIDTSGGVFGFSGIVDTLKTAWNSILPMKSEELITPINDNIKVSNKLVHDIHETVASAKTIRGTTKKCNDTDVLAAMMTAYNIAKGPKHNEEFGVEKYSINRILKSGQSTPNTCDILFEEIYELYEDYIQDITDPEMKGRQISAVRFTMEAVNGNAVPAMNSIEKITTNALGLMTDSSTLTPPYSGPTYAVDCRNPTILRAIKAKLESNFPVVTGNTSIISSYKTIKGSFQSTPLSCEYIINRNDNIRNIKINRGIDIPDNITYVKALFSLGNDGKTTTLSNVTEFDPYEVTYSNNTPYINGVAVDLPSIYDYGNPTVSSAGSGTISVSSRVNSSVLTI